MTHKNKKMTIQQFIASIIKPINIYTMIPLFPNIEWGKFKILTIKIINLNSLSSLLRKTNLQIVCFGVRIYYALL